MANLLHPGGFFTLTELEDAHAAVFKKTPSRMLRRNLLRFRKILKGIRKDSVKEEDLVKALATVLGLARRLGISIAACYPKFYFKVCRYCAVAPCWCTKNIDKPKRGLAPLDLFSLRADISFVEIQKSDWQVYPNQKSGKDKCKRGLHLAEEVLELLDALEESKPQRDKIEEEIADLFERIISLASSLDLWNFPKGVAQFYNRLQEGRNFYIFFPKTLYSKRSVPPSVFS